MKSKTRNAMIAALSAGATLFGASQAMSEEITVAYFLEWPMPFEYAKQMGTYEEALGVDINWVSFESGVKMSAAMASGDVHLSVSRVCRPLSWQLRPVRICKFSTWRYLMPTTTTASCGPSLRSTKPTPESLRAKKSCGSARHCRALRLS